MAMISRIKSSFMGTRSNLKLRLPGLRRQKERREIPSTECNADGGSSGSGGVAITKEDEYWRVFRYFDTNKDGKISASELRNYFASVGDSVSDEEASKIIQEFSKGKGGGEDSMRMEFGEFVRMAELRDGDVDDNVVILRRAFEVYEVDKGSGFITPEGLRCVLRRLGDVKSYQECEAMIRTYDLDGNGALDFNEFQRMMS